MQASTLRTVASPLTIVAAMLALVFGAAAVRVGAADHLDAPSLGSLSTGAVKGDRDINDVYAFPAPDGGNRTVLAVTVNPAINLFGGNFGTNVRYILNIDRNGDNVQDTAYVVRFGAEDANGNQAVRSLLDALITAAP